MRFFVVAVLISACGDNKAANPDAATDAIDAPTADTPTFPAATIVELTGTAYGAHWDAAASTLYITLDNRLDKWTEAGGVAAFGTFGGSPIGLGEIVQRTDGSFLVAMQGQGATFSNILTLSADGATPDVMTGLDGTRRRIGIALDPSGTLYDAFFVGNMAGMQTGGVASITTSEDVITTSMGLKKVTGIAATATTLYVCDQTATKIFAITIADGTTTPFATVPSCDLIEVMPNGDLVTGGLTGGIYRITPAGAVSSIRSGFEQVRGIAYDAVGKRLFAIEHRATMATNPRLHIFAVD